MKIQVDVWGGEMSQDLVACFLAELPKDAERIAQELADGFLLNLLATHGIQDDRVSYEFDDRLMADGSEP